MINKVEKHETDEVCNVCGKQQVVNQYGNKSCDNYSCSAHKHSTDIHWDSTDEEIEEWRSGESDITMSTYSVTKDGEEIGYVEAKKFEIEGGVLVFHEDPDRTGSLGEMTADTKIRAFNNWDEVERV